MTKLNDQENAVIDQSYPYLCPACDKWTLSDSGTEFDGPDWHCSNPLCNYDPRYNPNEEEREVNV
jgi:hypothetical protein